MIVKLFENNLELIPKFKQDLIIENVKNQILETVRFFYLEEDIDEIRFYTKGPSFLNQSTNALFINVLLNMVESDDIMVDVDLHLSNISMKNTCENDPGLSYLSIYKKDISAWLLQTGSNSIIQFWYNFNEKESHDWNGAI